MHLQILGFSDEECAKKIIEICNLPCSVKEYMNEVKNHVFLLKDTKLLPGNDLIYSRRVNDLLIIIPSLYTCMFHFHSNIPD